ncbi:Protein SEC13-like [Exaiptasia diaphana]|nr:Protein SEC13-like [Exaiptasia diaphana]
MKVSILNTVDTSHEDMVHDAQLDYYGKKLATCSSDKTVKIFETSGSQQTLVATLRGHDGPVWQVSWSHPMFGNLLASCSYDRKVVIWKESNTGWTKLQEFCNHDSSVNSICWAPPEYGLILACGSSDGSVSIISSPGDGTWDSKKINNAHTHPPTKAGLVEKRFVTGGCDNLVKIWKEVDGQWTEEDRLEAHSDWVRDVAWAPNIGLPTSTIASCSQDCRVIIWTRNEEGDEWTSKVLKKFSDVVWHVSWSVTGNILAISGGDNKVSLWKESLEGPWVCVNDVDKGQGQEQIE